MSHTAFHYLSLAVFLNFLLLVVGVTMAVRILRQIQKVFAELTSQHRAATHVTTMIGLSRALKDFAEQGGTDPKFRLKLHRGIEEQYERYLQALELDAQG